MRELLKMPVKNWLIVFAVTAASGYLMVNYGHVNFAQPLVEFDKTVKELVNLE